MKQLLLFLFAIIMCTSLLFADGTIPPGSGTLGAPYQVSLLDHLLWISTNSASWNSYFQQTANIDASTTSTWNAGAGFSPIGDTTTRFQGNYNGQGFSISGLFINRSATANIGLFGSLNNATISNLGLTGVNITGANYTGGLAGNTVINCTISDCYVTGTVSGAQYVGGLLGRNYNSSTITNCYVTGTVSGTSIYIGGLVGYNYSASINTCYASCTTSGYGHVGGLVGYNYSSSTINNCYATGNSSSTYDYTGGLVGNNSTGSTIDNCYSTGTASGGQTPFGGFIGKNDGTVTDCFWDQTTSGTSTGIGGGTTTGATGKTTAEMKIHTTFTDAGWDFEIETTNGTNDDWDMDYTQVYNSGYPYLAWQDGEDVSLPVELSGFSAHCAGQTVVLEWATESETDNLGFILERANGESQTWQVIASYKTDAALQSRGNSAIRNEYNFTDNSTQAGMRYQYRLSDVSTKGEITVYKSLSIEINAVPLTTVLEKAYPNPFNPQTLITYSLAGDTDVNLTVYDMLGRKVRELQTGHQAAGSYQVYWSGDDNNDFNLASGAYFIRLQTKDINQVQKVMLIK